MCIYTKRISIMCTQTIKVRKKIGRKTNQLIDKILYGVLKMKRNMKLWIFYIGGLSYSLADKSTWKKKKKRMIIIKKLRWIDREMDKTRESLKILYGDKILYGVLKMILSRQERVWYALRMDWLIKKEGWMRGEEAEEKKKEMRDFSNPNPTSI